MGSAQKPQMVLDCIESWKKHCPGFEIREWGEEELRKMGNRYGDETLKHKKWGFAADPLRLHVLKKYGGVWMDTDLLVTAPIDKFLDNEFFSGYEIYKGKAGVSEWFFGAEKGNAIISDLLTEFDTIPFVKPDGSFDTTTSTTRISRYFARKFGLNPPYEETRTVEVAPGIKVYPSHFFCAPKPGLENYTIHLFDGSWHDRYERRPHFSIGRLEFARFRSTGKKDRPLPLKEGEKLLLMYPTRLSGRKKLALILKPKKSPQSEK